MGTKDDLEAKKSQILSILKDDSLDANQKLESLHIEDMLETISIYEAELQAQNDELLEKEKVLSHSQEEFETLFNFAPIAYFELDSDFNVLQFNQSAVDLFKSNQLFIKKGSLFSNFVSQEDIINFLNFVNIVQEDYTAEIELNLGKMKEKLPVKLNIKKVIFVNGLVRYYLSVIDKTKEKQQQEMLMAQAKNVAMGEMLSMITHQWKQPLSVVLTFATTLEYKAELEILEDGELQDTLEKIKEQVQYMDETVHNFKHFFDEVGAKTVLQINNCVDRAIKFTSAAIKKADINLEHRYIDEPTLAAYGYSNDVCQILMNIINNAKDELIHKDGEKNISLSILNENDTIVIRVQNNGGHIPEECLESIFEKNFTTKGHEDGSGLGLYISQMIVKEHLKGELSVQNLESEKVEFTLKIPIYKG